MPTHQINLNILLIFTALVLAPQESWASSFVDGLLEGGKKWGDQAEAVERARNAPQNAETDLMRRQAELERARQENYLRQQQIERIEQERRQQQELQNANRERQQQLKNSIQATLNKISGFFAEYQQAIDNDTNLDVIKNKIAMYEQDSIPLSLLLLEKKVTSKEKKAVLQFLELQQAYAKKVLDTARTNLPASLAEILVSSEDKVREIGVALYKGKITYGEANSQLEENFKTRKSQFNAELAKITEE